MNDVDKFYMKVKKDEEVGSPDIASTLLSTDSTLHKVVRR